MNAPIFPLAYGKTLSLGESFEFQILGALVVFSALGLLWGALELTGYLFRRLEVRGRLASSASFSGKREAAGAGPASSLPAETLATLGAAVHITFNQPVRILSIRPGSEPETQAQPYLQAWTVEGRRQIFDSRRVR